MKALVTGCTGFIGSTFTDYLIPEGFEVSGGNRISVNDLITAIETVARQAAFVKHVAKQEGDLKDTCADTRKAEELLGWHARTGIDKGVERYVDWMRNEL